MSVNSIVETLCSRLVSHFEGAEAMHQRALNDLNQWLLQMSTFGELLRALKENPSIEPIISSGVELNAFNWFIVPEITNAFIKDTKALGVAWAKQKPSVDEKIEIERCSPVSMDYEPLAKLSGIRSLRETCNALGLSYTLSYINSDAHYLGIKLAVDPTRHPSGTTPRDVITAHMHKRVWFSTKMAQAPAAVAYKKTA